MAEPPAVIPASFEYPCPDEFGDDVVDVVGGGTNHRAKQSEIAGSPDDRCRLDHRHNIGVRPMQPGEQRLIERLGYAGLGSGGVELTDDMFYVERHPVP